MKQHLYKLTELIQDDDFIAWVLHPDETSNQRWRAYVTTFPEAEPTLRAASAYVLKLAKDTGQHQPTPAQSRRMWQTVRENTDSEEAVRPLSGWHSRVWTGWRVAASVALLLSISALAYWYVGTLSRTGTQAQRPVTPVVAQHPANSGLVSRINQTKQPMTLLLADGSSVVLLPGGTLTYATTNQADKREVTLSGRAFFEVVKDKTKPFLVYTDGMTTRVLGTSFLIDAPAGGETIDVRVKTGRVAVFPLNPRASATERADFAQLKTRSLIVNPNEQISISRLNGKPAKPAGRDVQRAVVTDIADQNFVFDETPASVVFARLEEAYNVQIDYDAQTMSACPLNATLMGEPLMQKLTVICAALDAEYTLQNNRITIKGRGCH